MVVVNIFDRNDAENAVLSLDCRGLGSLCSFRLIRRHGKPSSHEGASAMRQVILQVKTNEYCVHTVNVLLFSIHAPPQGPAASWRPPLQANWMNTLNLYEKEIR